MGKALKGWSLRHLLILSVALNVGLFLRLLGYEKLSCWRAEEVIEPGSRSVFDGFNVVETKNQRDVLVANIGSSSQMRPVVMATPAPIKHSEDEDRVINLDHGDPTMYEKFWQQEGDKTTVIIPGWQSMSYFSDPSNICWFLEPELSKEIIRLHKVVGNAVTDDRHIVVGTGSTQLFQAALYALSPSDGTEPISVVSAVPYYSFYRQVIDYLKSGLYKWAGDVADFKENVPYIELVTSPNNPDGFMRRPVVNRTGGMLVHDFAYYWPQYTPITSPADHELMLFTVSKSTGHAGMRIGWAIVKDKEVAKKMTKFIELSSIGVSKDSQLRAAKILQAVSDSSTRVGGSKAGNNFFEFSFNLMEERWKQLREAVESSVGSFSLPEFPPAFCKYSNRSFKTQPAFAWLKCGGEVEDCEGFLRTHKILTRSGKHFGMSPKYVRISILDRDANYALFIKRLSMIHT